MEATTPDQPGFKRTETGLWIPDLETAGLNALKIKEEGVLISDMMDPAEYAKSGCKFCHGKGEMQRMSKPGTVSDEVVWSLCICVIKNFPRGKENTIKLQETERIKIRDKKR